MSSFWTGVQELAEKAPEAGFANNSYGKLMAVPQVMRWEEVPGQTNGKGKPKRKPAYTPWVDGYQIDTERGESMALELTVDIQELNPALEFNLVRMVEIRKTSADGRAKTDWSEIVLPSLLNVFGSKWAEEIGKGVYVKVESVPQVNGSTAESGKVYTTIKFVEKYDSREACVAAHDVQFAKRDDATGESAVVNGTIPAEVIAQAKSLIASLGEKKAEETLASKPFGNYEPAELMKLAKAG